MFQKVVDELRRRYGVCPSCWDRQEGRHTCAEHGTRYILPGTLQASQVITVLAQVLPGD